MTSIFERVQGEARIVGLGELLRPRPSRPAPGEASSSSPEPQRDAQPELQPEPRPDPRIALEAERRAVLDAARKEGLASGLREAEDRVEARARAAEQAARDALDREAGRLAAASARLEALLAALPDEIGAIERRSEGIVAEAVFAATVRLVGELAREDARLVDYCRAALAAHSARPAVLRVRPDALEAVREAMPDAAADAVRVEGDAALGAMHCRIESERGVYDVSLEHRMEALKQALLASLIADDAGGRG